MSFLKFKSIVRPATALIFVVLLTLNSVAMLERELSGSVQLAMLGIIGGYFSMRTLEKTKGKD